MTVSDVHTGKIHPVPLATFEQNGHQNNPRKRPRGRAAAAVSLPTSKSVFIIFVDSCILYHCFALPDDLPTFFCEGPAGPDRVAGPPKPTPAHPAHQVCSEVYVTLGLVAAELRKRLGHRPHKNRGVFSDKTNRALTWRRRGLLLHAETPVDLGRDERGASSPIPVVGEDKNQSGPKKNAAPQEPG